MQNYNFALIKPVSGQCNLDCKYCFYRDVIKNRAVQSYGTMSIDTLKRAVMYTVSDALYGSSFLFQGGEPLLADPSFYARYNELCHDIKALRPEFKITSSVQTSAFYLKSNLIKELKDGNFLVGVSLDGPQHLHDINRVTKNGKGSFKKVFENIEKLKQASIPLNILCVITKDNAKPQELWRFFMDNGFDYLQFIKALKPLDSDRELISGADFADFFLEIFDLWFDEFCHGHYVSVRLIDDIFTVLSGHRISSCDLQGYCSVQNVIEADGSIYPCDFYVLDEWRLGNVNDERNLINKIRVQQFTKEERLPDPCLDCEAFAFCKNGCRRYRTQQGLNGYCETFKRIYSSRKKQLSFVLNKIKMG